MATRRRTDRRSTGRTLLALGALGVVFGDIGTSPLYAVQAVFSIDNGAVRATTSDVYGVISLIFWSITAVVSISYVAFVLRADNEGEGGVMSLAALTRRTSNPAGRGWPMLMLLGVVGAALFYGDSVITPAISVMSAVEGLAVPAPAVSHLVVPIGAVVLTLLFAVQRFGTGWVGRAFGPVMVVWFTSIGVLGLLAVVRSPRVLGALSPSYALSFVVERPVTAFIAMGAVVLAITGAEALYADMGHFGRPPISLAWFGLVFPCLVLNYLGQGATVLGDRAATANPFFLTVPETLRLPMVVLATAATVIASQSVISGAFSVSRQAERLGYLPRLTVRQTSAHEAGQIYVPVINWLLYAGVMLLLVSFRSSGKLATAYGLAVTGTFLMTTTLFLIHARTAWHWSPRQLLYFGVPIGGLELTYLAANMTKVTHGGWVPLLIAAAVILLMTTWRRGAHLITQRREALEQPLAEFLAEVDASHLARVPGTAVFLHVDDLTTPLALRANVTFNEVLHQQLLIVTIKPTAVPHVATRHRAVVHAVEGADVAITHVTLRYGLQDDTNVPAGLRVAARYGLDVDPDAAFYYLSRISIERGRLRGMVTWRKRLFIAMAHNSANQVQYFRLPVSRTVIVGAQIIL